MIKPTPRRGGLAGARLAVATLLFFAGSTEAGFCEDNGLWVRFFLCILNYIHIPRATYFSFFFCIGSCLCWLLFFFFFLVVAQVYGCAVIDLLSAELCSTVVGLFFVSQGLSESVYRCVGVKKKSLLTWYVGARGCPEIRNHEITVQYFFISFSISHPEATRWRNRHASCALDFDKSPVHLKGNEDTYMNGHTPSSGGYPMTRLAQRVRHGNSDLRPRCMKGVRWRSLTKQGDENSLYVDEFDTSGRISIAGNERAGEAISWLLYVPPPGHSTSQCIQYNTAQYSTAQ